MTREIKFRAWDKKQNQMVLIDPPRYHEKIGALVMYSSVLISDEMELMQYTGLKDNNGKDIYEGDIVNLTTNHIADLNPDWPKKTSKVEVKWENAMFKFGDMTMNYMPLRNAELKVIGNIYENPELLEETV